MGIRLSLLCLMLSVIFPAYSGDLTVVSWGGKYQELQRQIIFKPFSAQSGLGIAELSWEGGIDSLRSKIGSGQSDWDVVQVSAEEMLIGCREAMFLPINWAVIGGRQRFINNAVDDCGVGAVVYSLILSYDSAHFQSQPKSWADLWDFKKFPGKRALRKGPKTNLEIALLADGVKPEQIYEQLGTPSGVDRAFKKLAEIKSNVIWWEQGAQPQELLATGQVAMASAFNVRVNAANKENQQDLRMTWTNSLNFLDFWAIPKGSLRKTEVEQFIAYATSFAVQKGISEKLPYGQTRKDPAAPQFPMIYAPNIPSNPEYVKSALYINEQFWLDNQAKLNLRFNNAMLKK